MAIPTHVWNATWGFFPLCSCSFAQFEVARGFYVDMPSQLEEHANVAMSNMCRLQQHKYFFKVYIKGPFNIKELFLLPWSDNTLIEREIQEGIFPSLTCEEIGKCSHDMTHPCQKDLPPLFSRNRNFQAAKFWTLLRSIKSCVWLADDESPQFKKNF